MNTKERQNEIGSLYEQAMKAWASGNRLSNNKRIHMMRWRLRNDSKVKNQQMNSDSQFKDTQ
tara:strand:- start:7119 stop:7304 length:186 start_codon:yes stop_codon:yes gene_type:complete